MQRLAMCLPPAILFEKPEAKQYNEREEMMPLDSATKKKKIIRSILKDSALETFNNHISECEEPDKDGKSTEADKDDIEDALEKVTLKVFKNDIHAYRRQVRYMRYQLYFTGTNFQAFLHRLKQLNKYLKYFPISETTTSVQPLPDDDLIEIIDNVKTHQVQPVHVAKQLRPLPRHSGRILSVHRSSSKECQDWKLP